MANQNILEVSKELEQKALEAVRLAKQTGSVKKGANEATKSIERGLAYFVVVANDVEPKEVVMHIPMLCEQRKISLIAVSSKLDLGKAVGLSTPCAAIAVERGGEGDKLIKEVVSKVSGKEIEAPMNRKEQQDSKQEHKAPSEGKPRKPKKE